MKTQLATIFVLAAVVFLSGCDQTSTQVDLPRETTDTSTSKESESTPAARISLGEREKLKAIYDSAPAKRDPVEATLSPGSQTTRVDKKNGETSKLASILEKQGWIDPTITEGIREEAEGGYLYKLEVMMESDYYVIMKTDKALTQGTVISKSQGSPWMK